MRCTLLLVVLASATLALAADSGVIESTRVDQNAALTTQPTSDFWRGARPIYAEKGKYSEPVPGHRTEVRSRWTKENLYFLFICPYQQLNLKPSPNTSSETYELWNWDVAEVFIGSDFQHIGRYKEFEVSPQGEWVDLDIDVSSPHHEEGWKWNSGFEVAARVDREAKIWYGAMRIPFSALERHSPRVGESFRVNLFRSQGPSSDHKAIAWQPTFSETFHVPDKFGSLKLVGRSPR